MSLFFYSIIFIFLVALSIFLRHVLLLVARFAQGRHRLEMMVEATTRERALGAAVSLPVVTGALDLAGIAPAPARARHVATLAVRILQPTTLPRLS